MSAMKADPFDLFDTASNALEVAIEEHRDACKALIENYVHPGPERTSLLIHADDRAYQAMKGVHAIGHVADEAHSHARHLRVSPEGVAA